MHMRWLGVLGEALGCIWALLGAWCSYGGYMGGLRGVYGVPRGCIQGIYGAYMGSPGGACEVYLGSL